jgi:hypothetical protein
LEARVVWEGAVVLEDGVQQIVVVAVEGVGAVKVVVAAAAAAVAVVIAVAQQQWVGAITIISFVP